MPPPVPGRLAEAVRQSVVQVRSARSSLGSGVVVAAGRLITNAHVLGRIAVGDTNVVVETWEGSTLPATVLRISRSRDLAMLSVAGLPGNALPFGDSEQVQPGLPVFAIGHPLGFVGAVSSGVIHSRNPRWLCADVRLAPGNSGGPLTNFNGLMIGLNTMVMSGGLALAIPSRAMEQFLKQHEARMLGVAVRGVAFRGSFGVLVTGITPHSPAERASLLPGDILTAANGITFTHPDDLTDAIEKAADALLHLEFYRGDGKTARHVTANLAVREMRSAA